MSAEEMTIDEMSCCPFQNYLSFVSLLGAVAYSKATFRIMTYQNNNPEVKGS